MGVDTKVEIPGKSNLIKFSILSKRTLIKTQLITLNLKFNQMNS